MRRIGALLDLDFQMDTAPRKLNWVNPERVRCVLGKPNPSYVAWGTTLRGPKLNVMHCPQLRKRTRLGTSEFGRGIDLS